MYGCIAADKVSERMLWLWPRLAMVVLCLLWLVWVVWGHLGNKPTGQQSPWRQNFGLGLGLGPVFDLEIVIFVYQSSVAQLACRTDEFLFVHSSLTNFAKIGRNLRIFFYQKPEKLNSQCLASSAICVYNIAFTISIK